MHMYDTPFYDSNSNVGVPYLLPVSLWPCALTSASMAYSSQQKQGEGSDYENILHYSREVRPLRDSNFAESPPADLFESKSM